MLGQGSENYVQHVSPNVILDSNPIIAKSAVDFLVKPFAPLGATDLYPKLKRLNSNRGIPYIFASLRTEI